MISYYSILLSLSLSSAAEWFCAAEKNTNLCNWLSLPREVPTWPSKPSFVFLSLNQDRAQLHLKRMSSSSSLNCQTDDMSRKEHRGNPISKWTAIPRRPNWIFSIDNRALRYLRARNQISIEVRIMTKVQLNVWSNVQQRRKIYRRI